MAVLPAPPTYSAVRTILRVAIVLTTLMQRSSATAFQPVCRRPGGQ